MLNQIRFVFAQGLWIFSLINYEPLTYHNGQYEYPAWAHGIGWSITAISLVCIPAYAVVTVVRSEGDTWFQVRSCVCNRLTKYATV